MGFSRDGVACSEICVRENTYKNFMDGRKHLEKGWLPANHI